MPETTACLLVSVSARALACSAARGGLRLYAADLFADLDTRAACERVCRVDSGRRPFDDASLQAALTGLDPDGRLPLVYGSGFDAAPRQLARLARQRTLLGNPPRLVGDLKHPERLACRLARLGIPHPAIRRTAPARASGWLRKRAGGAGGGHVRPARSGERGGRKVFFQRRVQGLAVSVTVLSDGGRARLLGFTELLFESSLATRPFLYGGGLGLPATALPASVTADIETATAALVADTGLRGLWGMDLMVDGSDWWLLEVNPRPGASFELHEHGVSLFAAHLQACQGRMPESRPVSTGLHGQRIVYAAAALRVPDWREWPAWLSDRPVAGTAIGAGQPVCTVHAQAATPDALRRRLAERAVWADALCAGWRGAAA